MHTCQDHRTGSHTITSVCTAAGVDDRKTTAIKMRHRITTVYAAVNVPESYRRLFHKHMGHRVPTLTASSRKRKRKKLTSAWTNPGG